jgi:hypothetical protein
LGFILGLTFFNNYTKIIDKFHQWKRKLKRICQVFTWELAWYVLGLSIFANIYINLFTNLRQNIEDFYQRLPCELESKKIAHETATRVYDPRSDFKCFNIFKVLSNFRSCNTTVLGANRRFIFLFEKNKPQTRKGINLAIIDMLENKFM